MACLPAPVVLKRLLLLDRRSRDEPVAVIGFTIVGGRIAALNLIADQDKLRHLTIQP